MCWGNYDAEIKLDIFIAWVVIRHPKLAYEAHFIEVKTKLFRFPVCYATKISDSDIVTLYYYEVIYADCST